jgi:hypothetical protein
MNKSEQIGQLAEALSLFQGEIKDPIKNKVSHTSKYADLPSILELCRPLLSKNGLSIVQFPGNSANDKISIETVLMHKSGEWLSATYEMSAISESARLKSTNAAQADGIIITYARRYAITALLAIAAQDDTDANTGNSNKQLTGVQVQELLKACNNNKEKIDNIMKWAKVESINELSNEQYSSVMLKLKEQKGN